jgi:hypothetical protein
LPAPCPCAKTGNADLEARGSEAIRLPSREEVVERALLFEKNLQEDPVSGREELRRLFEGGKVLCRPQPDGFYLAEGNLLPLALFSMRLDLGTQRPATRSQRARLARSQKLRAPSMVVRAGFEPTTWRSRTWPQSSMLTLKYFSAFMPCPKP